MFNDLDFKTIAEIKTETIWPPAYSPVIGLIPYIKRMKTNVRGLIGIEIGTERGESAYQILDECKSVDKLYTIDPYKEYQNWNGVVEQENLDKFKKIAEKNLLIFGERVTMIQMTSKEAYERLLFTVEDKINHYINHYVNDTERKLPTNNEMADFIFIDGSVEYDDLLFDYTNWYKRLKVGGLFMGHNYQMDNVRKALLDFRNNEKVRIPINRVDNFSFMWVKQ